jgi:hypothetical protein
VKTKKMISNRQLEPELTNERAEKEWKWLCAKVGEDRARAAIAKIAGERKAFPLNIARVLGLDLPQEDQLPALRRDPAVARAALQEARKKLTGKG